jgi:hypothetical protein
MAICVAVPYLALLHGVDTEDGISFGPAHQSAKVQSRAHSSFSTHVVRLFLAADQSYHCTPHSGVKGTSTARLHCTRIGASAPRCGPRRNTAALPYTLSALSIMCSMSRTVEMQAEDKIRESSLHAIFVAAPCDVHPAIPLVSVTSRAGIHHRHHSGRSLCLLNGLHSFLYSPLTLLSDRSLAFPPSFSRARLTSSAYRHCDTPCRLKTATIGHTLTQPTSGLTLTPSLTPTTSDANVLVHTHTCGHQAATPTLDIYTTLKYTMTLTTPR